VLRRLTCSRSAGTLYCHPKGIALQFEVSGEESRVTDEFWTREMLAKRLKSINVTMMTNLRHPSLRIRDIRKIIIYKRQAIKWEQGLEGKTEWVFASLENAVYKEKLLVWLTSKNILPLCELLLIDPSCSKIQKLRWEEILSNPERYFGNSAFHLYDIDLEWVLEYSTTQVVRFGRISEKTNAWQDVTT
jgi:hypothetical protein